MANFYFTKPVRLCDVVVSLQCEDCPIGHILTGDCPCPEFECTREVENFLLCIGNCSNETLEKLREIVG